MSWPLEYRVIWQREGQAGKNRRIYQTLAGAQSCARIQATAHDEMDWLDDEDTVGGDRRPRPIIFGPIIESRMVGEWVEVEKI